MLSGRLINVSVMLNGSRTYSAQEVADRLGVAEKTVRRWIESGRLRADRVGHRFAVDMRDAELVYAESRSGRVGGRGAEAESEARRLENELAVMRGRYAELQELVERLEAALGEERRRTALLEARLELRAAA